MTIVDDFIAPPCEENIKILYEDEAILLIHKPSGLLSLSGKNPLNLDSVHYRLTKTHPSATLLHRLDFGTSGIMLVALNKEVNANLTKQFQARTIEKFYRALLNGLLEQEMGVISLPIAKDPDMFPRMKICVVNGKPAQTLYTVLERFPEQNMTKVEFKPETGRTHQLRIHSREFGHSILGCDLYASKMVHERAERLMLHAYRLSFDHPISGQRMCVVDELRPFT